MHRIILLSLSAMICLASSAFAADRAPDFTLPDVNGDKVRLSDKLKNGPVLLDFWATWCKPCLQELPSLERIRQLYSKDSLQVLAISTDNPKSSSNVKPFTRGQGFQFTVLLDTDSEVRKLFGGTTMPFSVLIAPSGDVVYQHLGYVPGDEKGIEEEIIKLLSTLKDKEAGAEAAPQSQTGENR
jgi:peroxiredoxin